MLIMYYIFGFINCLFFVKYLKLYGKRLIILYCMIKFRWVVVVRKLKSLGETRIKPKSNKKKIIIISVISVAVLLIFVLLFYFLLSMNDSESKKKDKVKIDEASTVEKKDLTVYDVNSNKRPIAIMIDNNVGNNAHVGLQDAYLTYEIIVEGGLTRIMAIFKDVNTSVIGPVRSSRHYFLDYALESDAIYAHYGWSTYAENDIRALGVNNINGLYDNGYYRNYNIAAPHNVFTSIEDLYNVATSKGYSTTSNNYNLLNYTTDDIAFNDTIDLLTANNVSMTYSYSQGRSYTYDSTNRYYLRYMNNSPHTDRDSGLQYHYKNIIIMKVNNSTLDSYGRQDLDTVDTGEGYYITNGYAVPITWSKTSRSDKTRYYYKSGNELVVADGNTMIHVVPLNSNIVFS